MASPNDDARKARIINHMNNDHTRELSHYLRHYAHLSARAAASPTMQDVDLQGMAISTQGQRHVIPFAPPLDSWAEVKARIIEMDAVARAGLGIADTYVTEYVPPEGFDVAVFGAVLFYYFCAASLPWTAPGSGAWDFLQAWFPGGGAWYQWVVRVIFVPVVMIHVVECYFLSGKLRRYGVERATTGSLWWKWQASCFIEGYPSFNRLERIVARKRAEKNARK